MKPEKYLQSIRDMNFKLELLETKRKTYSTPIRQKAITYDKLNIQSSPSPDKLENDVIRTIEQIERLDDKIINIKTRLEHRRDEALDRIMRMKEGQSRRFLIDYYIRCLSIKRISSEYSFRNERTVYSLKKRAIKNFEKISKKC